jgi:glycosyltransferase involved in cell wall biosynthesis
MKNHKYTIVIPTRNRAHTLRHTIASCLAVDYDNFEVLVSDDNSADDTTTIVRSFNDKRLKYFHTGMSTGSMAGNWEFALEQVKETDFVIVVGDDDALLADSLTLINQLINKHLVSAVTWRKIDYQWPDHMVPAFRNCMTLSLNDSYSVIDTKFYLKKAMAFGIGYDMLPCLYNSAVSFKILHEIREICKGKYFFGTSPDVYSAFANACFIDQHIYSNRPFSINGASGKSNGTMQFNTQIDHKKTEEVVVFYEEIQKNFNSRLVICPSFTFAVADSIFSTQDNLGKYFPYQADIRVILSTAIMEIQHFDEQRYQECRSAILTTAKLHGIQGFAEKILKDTQWAHKPTLISKGLNGSFLTIDASGFSIQNVFDAAKFCLHFYEFVTPREVRDPLKTTLLRQFWKKMKALL